MESETNKTDETKEAMQNDAKIISLVSGLQTAILENNYDDFNKALDQIQEYVDKESGLTDEAQKTEEFARIAMSARADISGNGRNVFMIELANIPADGLKNSILYQFAENYNPDSKRDTRILSLLGRSTDGNGESVYDYLIKLNPREMDRKSPEAKAYTTILSSMKKAMDNDAEVPTDIQKKYNISALELGIKNRDLLYYNTYIKQKHKISIEVVKETKQPFIPDFLIPPYVDQRIIAEYERAKERLRRFHEQRTQ